MQKIVKILFAALIVTCAINTMVECAGQKGEAPSKQQMAEKRKNRRKEKSLANQLENAEEKLKKLEDNPNATSEQIDKQKSYLADLRDRASNWIKDTYKYASEMNTSTKVLLATIGITGAAIAADYAMGTGYVSGALNKARGYMGWESNISPNSFDRIGTPGSQDLSSTTQEQLGQVLNQAGTSFANSRAGDFAARAAGIEPTFGGRQQPQAGSIPSVVPSSAEMGQAEAFVNQAGQDISPYAERLREQSMENVPGEYSSYFNDLAPYKNQFKESASKRISEGFNAAPNRETFESIQPAGSIPSVGVGDATRASIPAFVSQAGKDMSPALARRLKESLSEVPGEYPQDWDSDPALIESRKNAIKTVQEKAQAARELARQGIKAGNKGPQLP